jgi:hypothetical protein
MLVFDQCRGVPRFTAFVILHVHRCTFFSLFGNFLEQLPGDYSFSSLC